MQAELATVKAERDALKKQYINEMLEVTHDLHVKIETLEAERDALKAELADMEGRYKVVRAQLNAYVLRDSDGKKGGEG